MSGIATGIIGIGTAVFGAFQSGRARREARRQKRIAAARLQALEANRQDIVDPFEGVENPYQQMQVATRSTEIAAEQADISLASSLDTLRATGASAGGATALARAATQAKRKIGADIEKQEMALQKLKAQGTMQFEAQKARSASATMARQEARENQQLNRQSSLMDSYAQQETAAKQQMMGNIGAAVGGLATMGMQQGWFKSTPPQTPTVPKINPESRVATGNVSLTDKSGNVGMYNRDSYNLNYNIGDYDFNIDTGFNTNTNYNTNTNFTNSRYWDHIFGRSGNTWGTSSAYHSPFPGQG